MVQILLIGTFPGNSLHGALSILQHCCDRLPPGVELECPNDDEIRAFVAQHASHILVDRNGNLLERN
jgi:hypothetical protein